MNKIRVLFSSHEADLNGAPKSLSQIIKEIDKRKYKISVVCYGKGEFTEDLEKYTDNIYIVERTHKSSNKMLLVNKSINLFRSLTRFISYFNVIKKDNPDVIYVNTISLCTPLIPALILGKPVIVHVRESIFHFINNNVIKYLSHFLFKRIPKLYIANSKETVNNLHKNGYKKNKIRLVYNGVDLCEYKADSASSSNIRKDLHLGNQFIVGYIGRPSYVKGFDFFCAIIEMSMMHNDAFVFLAVGFKLNEIKNTDISNKIQKLVDLNKLTIVERTKHISNYINCMDVIVITSRHESFCRVAVESMALSKTVVATNTGALPEVIEKDVNGFLVDFGDVEGFYNKISTLKEDIALRHSFGLEGRHRAETLFDSQVCTYNCSCLIDEVVTL